jgi:hypothetical protein
VYERVERDDDVVRCLGSGLSGRFEVDARILAGWGHVDGAAADPQRGDLALDGNPGAVILDQMAAVEPDVVHRVGSGSEQSHAVACCLEHLDAVEEDVRASLVEEDAVHLLLPTLRHRQVGAVQGQPVDVQLMTIPGHDQVGVPDGRSPAVEVLLRHEPQDGPSASDTTQGEAVQVVQVGDDQCPAGRARCGEVVHTHAECDLDRAAGGGRRLQHFPKRRRAVRLRAPHIGRAVGHRSLRGFRQYDRDVVRKILDGGAVVSGALDRHRFVDVEG